MNLYNLHSAPESLLYFGEATEIVPVLFWEKYKDNKEELKMREKAISRDAEYSYLYARIVLRGPFPLGEEAIAKSSFYSYLYAHYVLKGPFPAGEAAIAADGYYANTYANKALKKDFYYDGKLIAQA